MIIFIYRTLYYYTEKIDSFYVIPTKVRSAIAEDKASCLLRISKNLLWMSCWHNVTFAAFQRSDVKDEHEIMQ